MDKIDCIICLGKNLNDDGSLDWVFQERVNLAGKIFVEHPESVLVLTGGISHLDNRSDLPSQAFAMLKFLKENFKIDETNIILEEEGVSTIHQLCIIKNDILIPQKFKNIAIVTDVVHEPRATVLAEHIFGPEFNVKGHGSIVNIGGEYRKSIDRVEKEKYEITVESIVKKFEKGDDKGILEREENYRKGLKEKNISN